MKKIQIIKVIRSLITMNNSRIEGYETAARATQEFDLKILFAQFILTSRTCNNQLVAEVEALKVEAVETKTKSGKFFLAWLDVKTALAGRNRQAILKSCAFGENQTKEKYSTTLKNGLGILNNKQQLMITRQTSMLKLDQDHIKTLRNGLADT